VLTGVRTGFCALEKNVYGPVHVNVAPGLLVANSFTESASPEQIGELLDNVIGGVGVTVAAIVACTVHEPRPTTTVYTPDANGVAPYMIGF